MKVKDRETTQYQGNTCDQKGSSCIQLILKLSGNQFTHCNTIQHICFIGFCLFSFGMKSVKINKRRKRRTSFQIIIRHIKSGMDTQLWGIIENMLCSNRFGKKALSYSIIKTSQWKITVCPFVGKDQQSHQTHTHTHGSTHTYIKCLITVEPPSSVLWY